MPNITKQEFFRLRRQGYSVEEIKEMERGDRGFQPLQAIRNIPRSALRYGKAIGTGLLRTAGLPISGLLQPKKTREFYQALGGLGVGAVAKAIPGRQPSEKYFDALVQTYQNRYGTPAKTLETIEEDPVGVAADVADLLTLAGAGISVAGKAGRLEDISRAGQAVSRVGRATEPLSIAGRTIGRVGRAAERVSPEEILRRAPETEAMRVAERADIELPASALREEAGIAALERWADKSPLIGRPLTKKLNRAKSRLDELGESMVRQTEGSEDITKAGKAIADDFEEFRKTHIETKNALYDKVDSTEEITLNRSKNIIANTIKRKRGSKLPAANLKYYEDAFKSLTGKEPTSKILRKADDLDATVEFNVARNTLRELNKRIKNWNDPVVTGENANLKRIAATMADEIDDGAARISPELAEGLRIANDWYKNNLQKINSRWGRKIQKTIREGNYSKLYDSVIRRGSIEDTRTIMGFLSEEGKQEIRSLVTREAIDSFITPGGRISSVGLGKIIKRWGEDKLITILGDDNYRALEEIDELAQAIRRGYKKIGANRMDIYQGLLGRIAFIMISPFSTLKEIIGDAAFGKFISSQRGQRMLIEGIPAPNIGRVADLIRGKIKKTNRVLVPIYRLERMRRELEE